jgi:hypothetical protein
LEGPFQDVIEQVVVDERVVWCVHWVAIRKDTRIHRIQKIVLNMPEGSGYVVINNIKGLLGMRPSEVIEADGVGSRG